MNADLSFHAEYILAIPPRMGLIATTSRAYIADSHSASGFFSLARRHKGRRHMASFHLPAFCLPAAVISHDEFLIAHRRTQSSSRRRRLSAKMRHGSGDARIYAILPSTSRRHLPPRAAYAAFSPTPRRRRRWTRRRRLQRMPRQLARQGGRLAADTAPMLAKAAAFT